MQLVRKGLSINAGYLANSPLIEKHKIPSGQIQKGVIALLRVLQDFSRKGIELERVCRVATLLCYGGIEKNSSLFDGIASRCLSEQKNDGGWVGVEDSLWCVAFLKNYQEHHPEYASGLDWLERQRLANGAWGYSNRDIGRIPLTGLLLYLLPELSSEESCNWLESEWKKEFALSPKLTYKCAFTVLGLANQFADNKLLDRSLDWLASQQNEDAGFSPWKNHPVGSNPWCTGISILGLLQKPSGWANKAVINSMKWLEATQLPEGLWPYHYIEEGSVWALLSLIKGYTVLCGEAS
jgi:hypothetical protein